MMKKYIFLLIVMMVGLFPTNAATRYDIHLVGGYAGAGFSALIHQYDNFKFIGGGGGILGAQYEYQYKKFMLNLGPEFRVFSSTDNLLHDQPYSIAYTRDGYPQTKLYRFSDFKETQAIGQIMLPIMLGGNFDKVYFSAGVKVGYTVLRRYSQKGMLTSSMVDDLAYDEWFDIPSHALSTGSYAYKGKNTFGFDMTLSAEVGVNIDKLLSKSWQEANEKRNRPLRMRAAVFVDGGIPNMNISTDVPFAVPTPDEIITTSLFQTDWAQADSWLSSLLVGVKFTALLQLNKPKGKRQPNPRLAAQIVDEETGKTLPNTKVTVYNEKNKRKSTKTANKQGYLITRLAPGGYRLTPYRNGYLPAEAVSIMHEGDLKDTIILSLRPEPVFSCEVVDAKTNDAVKATLEFVDNQTGIVAFTTTTDSLGAARIKLKYGNTYTLKVSANDYLFQSFAVADLGANEKYTLEPIVKGVKVVLKNLFFATNKTTILPTSEASLQELYTFLSENEDVRIRIIGHTDNVGSDEANQKLSDGRAASVKASMVERGIDADRMETEGRGESEPVDTNDTEEGRANNRRVEFVIL